MDQKLDLYTILGLSPQSTNAEIKKQFKKISREMHPDKTNYLDVKQRDNIKKVYDEIVLAYSILGNDKLKEEYDRLCGFYKESSFEELKKQSSKDLEFDLSTYASEHEREISQRHTHLLSSYRERNISEFKKTPSVPMGKISDLKKPFKRRENTTKDITVVPEPVTFLTLQKGVELQTISKIGELYYSGKPEKNMYEYATDVTLEDNEEAENAAQVSINERLRQEETLRCTINYD